MRFGLRFNADCENLRIARGGSLQWSSQCRYLGVYFVSGRALRCSFDQCKCRYYRAYMCLWFARDIWRYRNVFWLIDWLMRCSVKLDDLRLKKSFYILYGINVYPCYYMEQRLVLCLYETNALQNLQLRAHSWSYSRLDLQLLSVTAWIFFTSCQWVIK